MNARKSSVFVVSAPSGAGKSTLIQRLLTEVPLLCFSISHTTRPPREGERHGVEYFFTSESEFRNMVASSKFLEWAEVHGQCYGTSRQMLENAIAQGKDLILDIDIQGARSVRKVLPETVNIFILPPSNQALRERLERRQKDSEEQIARRIENAHKEIQCWEDYDYIILNEDLDSAFENLAAVIKSTRCRKDNIRDRVKEIVDSFHS